NHDPRSAGNRPRNPVGIASELVWELEPTPGRVGLWLLLARFAHLDVIGRTGLLDRRGVLNVIPTPHVGRFATFGTGRLRLASAGRQWHGYRSRRLFLYRTPACTLLGRGFGSRPPRGGCRLQPLHGRVPGTRKALAYALGGRAHELTPRFPPGSRLLHPAEPLRRDPRGGFNPLLRRLHAVALVPRLPLERHTHPQVLRSRLRGEHEGLQDTALPWQVADVRDHVDGAVGRHHGGSLGHYRHAARSRTQRDLEKLHGVGVEVVERHAELESCVV